MFFYVFQNNQVIELHLEESRRRHVGSRVKKLVPTISILHI